MTCLLLCLNSIDGELKSLLISHCPSLPASMQHAYVMGLFAHTETELLSKLETFQSGYGFSWWKTEKLRLKALVNQNNSYLPVRTKAGYWRTTNHINSSSKRKHQYSKQSINDMSGKPDSIVNQINSFKNKFDSALSMHQSIINIAPHKGALWAAKLTGSPAAIQNQIQQLSMPEHQHFVACMIVSDAPIQEYDTLCQ